MKCQKILYTMYFPPNDLIIEKSFEQNKEQIFHMWLVELFLNVIDTSITLNEVSGSTH